jgi:calcineurin-like phosphoesterase family protein
MKIYVTSDTHLNHKKLIEWGRPVDFEERIIQNHNKIEADSVLIHLGDICIGRDEDMHQVLMDAIGHIEHRILVRGNHDKKSNQWYLEHGWNAVAEQLTMKLFGKQVIFSHIPVAYEMWPATDLNVHGHTHGNGHRDRDVAHFLSEGYHREVAMENTNYQPILVTEKWLHGKRAR